MNHNNVDYLNHTLIKKANQQRVDILIRILFIEWYYKKNDYGHRLYESSHKAFRINRCNWEICGPDCFIELIESFEKNGFDKTKPLKITKDYELYNDGAHRLACIIYFNIINVPVEILNVKIKYCNWYDVKWLKQNFSKTDSKIVLERYNHWINSSF